MIFKNGNLRLRQFLYMSALMLLYWNQKVTILTQKSLREYFTADKSGNMFFLRSLFGKQ